MPRVDRYLRGLYCALCGAPTWMWIPYHGPQACTPCSYRLAVSRSHTERDQ